MLNVPILALGATLLVSVLLIAGKVVGLRKSMIDQWGDQVDLDYAGLSERANVVFLRLRDAVDQNLGAPGSGFDPDEAIADPNELKSLIDEVTKILDSQKKLKKRYERLLLLSKYAPYIILGYIVGVLVAVSYYGGFQPVSWVGNVGAVLALASVVAAATLTGVYWRLTTKLTSTQQLARDRDSVSGGGT